MIWELLGVLFAAALSASILPGVTEAVMAGVLCLGSANLWPVVAFATVGSVLGSAAQWFIGRFFSQYKDHKRFPLKADDYDKYSRWFGKYGVWTLLLAWLPGVGDVMTLVAGLFRTPFVLSMVLVAIAKGARFALFGYLFVTGAPVVADLFDVQLSVCTGAVAQ
jgi:membrane protein YqaA with SNARE-associated domain